MNPIYSFEEVLDTVNKSIQSIKYTQEPQTLFDPIEYILSLGGKRIRPALALMACNLYKDEVEDAIPVAMGIEIFHNFTLLHDDLMDKADMRRSKPTVHIKWSDNTAVLSGDAMLIEAYKEISKVHPEYLRPIIDLFSTTATEICCGQQLDMEFEQRMDVSTAEYIEMIRLKTAVLLACALKEGAMVAGAAETDTNHLYDFGINIGLAFQLKDDLLDVYGDSETFGKRIGGDILCNKKTYLLINALADKPTRDKLTYWIEKEKYEEEEKIKAVTAIYDSLCLKQKSEVLINDYYEKSIDCLRKVNVAEERKKVLLELAESLKFRNT